ncbi:MAG: pentapeptide repeat-containing protein [candidate division Zixibacteria bacterium]|nr:pentapeptide repeat-containing protein [candidate division Zixibacteria bacterium]
MSSFCQERMLLGRPCGRPAYVDPASGLPSDKCIFHCYKETGGFTEFQNALDAYLSSNPKDYDFHRFVFPCRGWKFPSVFPECAYFNYAVFKGDVYFGLTRFQKKAVFTEVTFEGRANFCTAKFNWDGFFLNSEFRSLVDFAGAEFCLGQTDFRFCKFRGDVTFFDCKFQKGVAFPFARFEKAVDFRDTLFGGNSDFSEAVFAEPERVTFSGNNLSHVSFARCNIAKTIFQRVEWLGIPVWPKAGILRRWIRNGVVDELPSSGQVNHEDLAQTYRRLQHNYMENYRYSEAGDFFVGERESLRRGKVKWRQYASIDFLYKLASLYGESYTLPFVWLAVLLLLTPLALLAAVGSDCNVTYWHAFLENLELFIFPRIPDASCAATAVSRLTICTEKVLVVLFVSLLLLALRRKFKRKSF